MADDRAELEALRATPEGHDIPPLASRAIRRACKHEQTKGGYCWSCGTKVSRG